MADMFCYTKLILLYACVYRFVYKGTNEVTDNTRVLFHAIS